MLATCLNIAREILPDPMTADQSLQSLALQPIPGQLSAKNWKILQFGLVLLPFSSFLGFVVLLWPLIALWRKHWLKICRDRFFWGLAVITLWLIFTTIFAVNPWEALLGLANFLPYFACFVGFSYCFQQWQHLRQFAWILVLPSFAISLLGMGQITFGWGGGKVLQILGFSLNAWGNPEGRLSSVFMYANLCSAYFVMIMPLAMGLGIDAFGQWQRDGKFRNLQWAIILGIIVLSDAIALILTDSRSAWAIMVVICLAFALYLGWNKLVLAIAAVVGTVLWSAWGPFGKASLRQIVPDFFWARLTDEKFSDRYMTAFRSTQWKFATQMGLERPWVGFGLRNFTPQYRVAMNVWMGHPHNLPLMFLAETGFPGLVLILAWVGCILAQGVFFWHRLGYFARSGSVHKRLQPNRNRLLLGSYLLAFGSCCLFNLTDVTIFELRINLFGWLLLAAIYGITTPYRRLLFSKLAL
jgi:hypothetical protein